MRRIEFTPRARRDIEDIWSRSRERFGVEKAEAYLRDIQRAAETVAEDPRRGRACDDIRVGYRKFSVGARSVLSGLEEQDCHCQDSSSAHGL
jgi:toxin ParE1/3/4